MIYSKFIRYGFFFLPPAETALSTFGKRWLGWSIDEGRSVKFLENISENHEVCTSTARKYGFHGTLKPPFILKNGYDPAHLHQAAAELVGTFPKFLLPQLELAELDGFLALRPVYASSELSRLAKTLVCELDHFRAAADEKELQRRRSVGLTPRQDALLMQWGYPYVLQEFKFHLTLTSRLPCAEAETVRQSLQFHLDKKLLAAQIIDTVGFVGEKCDGTFHLIERLSLLSPKVQLD